MPTRFFAHSTSSKDQHDWEPLKDHLQAVAHAAAERANKFGAGSVAYLAGLLHDLGKYRDEFQRRLIGSTEAVDHAAPGGVVAIDRFGPYIGKLLAFAITGHHTGLANATVGRDASRTPLGERLDKVRSSAKSVLEAAIHDGLSVPASPPAPNFRERQGVAGFQFAFLGRMLFSCLVDADYVETERFYAGIEGRKPEREGFPGLDVLADVLDKYLEGMVAAVPDTPVNRLRIEILSHVRSQSDRTPGIFTLTVPTGGGKTLASLAFALDHARHHGLNRVIFVIPYTSIIDQTANVYRAALAPHSDAVLEHHSAFDESKLSNRWGFEKLKLAMENWEAPIVVTTAVQFFESLFADRPSRCRKLHNIANSIVVLDEAQILPQHLLRPCVAALDELARNYRTSIVLSTATQPALQKTADPQRSFSGGFQNVQELAPEPPRLFALLTRVRIEVAPVPLADNELVARISATEQGLCIVNSRAHARELYAALRHVAGARHLSTLMCAVHRREILTAIRRDLENGRPCRVVATSLVEAGVDVDFPLVMRAEGGLDSIAQAAGRCNREGRRPAETSLTIVFEAVGHPPPKSMRALCDAGRAALRRFPEDPLSPEAIEFFFRELYWAAGEARLDAGGILSSCNTHAKDFDFPYESIASDFLMIDDFMLPVIIPFDAHAREYLQALEYVESPGAIARKLQPYVVPIPPNARTKLIAAGAAAPIRESDFGDQFVCLFNEHLYDQATGLHWNEPTFRNAETLIG